MQNLVRLLDSYVRDGRPFDLARKIHFFALDVISELAFGEPFGDLTTDSDVHSLVTDIETYLPYLIVSTVMSWMIPVLGLPVFRPLMPSEHDVLGIGRLVGFVMTPPPPPMPSMTMTLVADFFPSLVQNRKEGGGGALRAEQKDAEGHGRLLCRPGTDAGAGGE